jgi:hypothetical protein
LQLEAVTAEGLVDTSYCRVTIDSLSPRWERARGMDKTISGRDE